MLFILSFIRWEVGTDWDSYFRYYNGIKGTLENVFYFEYNRFEIGYEIDILDGKVNTVPLSLILNKIGFPTNWREIENIK